MKTRRNRNKPCARCTQEPGTLFRARVAADGPWLFLCEPCVLSAKRNNPDYQYGGTWKARKRH